jgi:phosphoesterase RecJ-like protein
LEITVELRPSLIDDKIATHWYMWLLADTWSFQYQQDSLRTFWNAQKLIWYGADKDLLVEKLFNNNPPALLDFMKLITPRIHFADNVVSIWYTLDEIKALWLEFDELWAFMYIIRSIYWFAVFAEIKVLPDGCRISLRSGYTDRWRVDVQKIAKTLNGWGHMYAAGCIYPYSPELAIENQINTIISHLQAETAKQL